MHTQSIDVGGQAALVDPPYLARAVNVKTKLRSST